MPPNVTLQSLMTLMVAWGKRELVRWRPGPSYPSQRMWGGHLGRKQWLWGGGLRNLSLALLHASWGQGPPSETGSGGLRVTLDQPFHLRRLGFPVCKMGAGTPASTEEASVEAKDR